jgi:hypothetical protein
MKVGKDRIQNGWNPRQTKDQNVSNELQGNEICQNLL